MILLDMHSYCMPVYVAVSCLGDEPAHMLLAIAMLRCSLCGASIFTVAEWVCVLLVTHHCTITSVIVYCTLHTFIF